MTEWDSEWVCVLTARWGPELHILCSVPLTFHMTWEDVEQSAGPAEVQYKYTCIYIHKIKSACKTHTCSKRNIWTDACQQVHMHMLKKSINTLKRTSGHCLEYTPSNTIFHEQQTWRHSQLKIWCLIHTHSLCWPTLHISQQVGNWHQLSNSDGEVSPVA